MSDQVIVAIPVDAVPPEAAVVQTAGTSAPTNSGSNNNNGRRGREYAKVNLNPGQRIIDPSIVSTAKVNRIVDITGDKHVMSNYPKTYFSEPRRRYILLAVAVLTCVVAGLLVLVNPYVGLLATLFAFFFLIAAILINTPTMKLSNTYVNGRYDQQMVYQNKKAVYVLDLDGTVTKYICRVGPKPKHVDAGCAVM